MIRLVICLMPPDNSDAPPPSLCSLQMMEHRCTLRKHAEVCQLLPASDCLRMPDTVSTLYKKGPRNKLLSCMVRFVQLRQIGQQKNEKEEKLSETTDVTATGHSNLPVLSYNKCKYKFTTRPTWRQNIYFRRRSGVVDSAWPAAFCLQFLLCPTVV